LFFQPPRYEEFSSNILSEYYHSVFNYFTSRVVKTLCCEWKGFGLESHWTYRSIFQYSVVLCNVTLLFATTRNNQNVLTVIYLVKYLCFPFTNKI
jgi:hypothetical protein